MSCLYVFQVLGFHLVADFCAGLQFPIKIFELSCAENGPLFLYKICEPILQLEHMKDNPVFTLNRNALQGASVTENDGRKVKRNIIFFISGGKRQKENSDGLERE